MRAVVVPHMSDEVTHIVQLGDPNLEEDTGEEWYRTLEKLGGYCLLHYWYKPDSADMWVPELSGEYMDPEPPPEHEGPWHVSTRWLRDSAKYNEWMNEEDYEVEEREYPEEEEDQSDEASQEDDEESDQADEEEVDEEEEEEEEEEDEAVSVAELLDDRSSVAPNEDILEIRVDDESHRREGLHPVPMVEVVDIARRMTKSKKSEYEPFEPSLIHNISACLPTSRTVLVDEDLGAVDRRANFVRGLALRKGNLGEWQGDGYDEMANGNGTYLPTADSAAQDDTESNEMVVDAEAGADGSDSASSAHQSTRNLPIPPTLPLPAHASWFALDDIHQIERLAFPELSPLFEPTSPQSQSSKTTDKEYRRVRNFMVSLYHLDTAHYLTVGECYRYLEGDVEFLMKVHACLEKWSIINFAVYPHHSLPITSFTYQAMTISSEALPLSFDNLIHSPPSAPVVSGPAPSCPSCAQFYGPTRYVSTKIAAFEICDECFLDGRYPIEMVGRDFLRMEGFAAGVKRKRGSDDQGEGGKRGKDDEGVLGGKPASIEGRSEAAQDGDMAEKSNATIVKGNRNQMPSVVVADVADEKENDAATWTEEEVLRLFEGVEMYGGVKRVKDEDVDILDIMDVDGDVRVSKGDTKSDMKDGEDTSWDWEKISQHVGTKDAKACLLRFATMDLEEEAEAGGQGSRILQQTAFIHAANPLMSLLRFLGNVVTPGVAAVAAGEGLKVLLEAAQVGGNTAEGDGQTNATDQGGRGVASGDIVMDTPVRREAVLEAAEAAIRAAVKKAEELATIEGRQVELLIRLVVDAVTRKAERRMDMLDGGKAGTAKKSASNEPMLEDGSGDVSSDPNELENSGLGDHMELIQTNMPL
ncbi:SWI SNF, matrix associated, actin dependent regulator of chromatin, sub c, member 2 [Rhizophlyctis rosea]|uniref:SWI SNF, matrix associated, actin dependent regulator of chromatin, sub c, member 2 n=1 Tax=Rhizophlyctis rosea TaxID=64517 RepID=A0AAD5SGK9_9FUNG|nr:SWI SNF, matrix associated, actin dependent regulator of chromatin, sub c, member 2 [Rhizophlyctis rosea]